MNKTTFSIAAKASVSLCSLLGRSAPAPRPVRAAHRASRNAAAERSPENDPVSVILETNDPSAVCNEYDALQDREKLQPLAGGFVSARVNKTTLERLLADRRVKRLQAKKRSVLHLTEAARDIRLASAGNPRVVAETGQGVLIGVVDSGFDLSHPAFRDGNGLRVAALLDQTNNNREFTTAQLTQRWASGTGPGADEDGHGTHVASITGGTRHQGFEGVAPGARFLLVKTDMENTDDAVKWIFDKAAALSAPCVVNMSLGHHWGSHDGTDAEERLHRTLTGAGKLIVVSAGNERADSIHIGGRFTPNQTEEAAFDLLRPRDGSPGVVITLWHPRQDKFDVALVTPGGQVLPVPALGRADEFTDQQLSIELARRRYSFSQSTQIQITIQFQRRNVPSQSLRHWKLRMTCKQAVVGRLDGWFHNSGFAEFRPHPLLETHRTIGLAATGEGCLAVASHVTRSDWDSDAGPQTDPQVVKGRTSSFSSLGPTRDGREKPDFSAPGQYVTAALANDSESAGDEARAHSLNRLLTIEGTSMATPVVTGIVALLLQKKPALTLAQAREALKATARRDLHTGPASWDPAYGFGKVDVAAALNRI